MLNDVQKIMDSLVKDNPFTNCYIDDILIASQRSLEEQKTILMDADHPIQKNMAVK